jgi:hypothetical protein
MRVLFALAVSAFVAVPAIPHEKTANNGAVEGRVTRPGGKEGIAEVQVTLQGPTQTFDSGLLKGLYTPRAELTPEMRQEINRLIESAPAGVAPESVANAAARREAQLLGLPLPGPLPNLPVAETAPPPSTTVFTEADGRFSFKKLAPGRYTINVQREGYLGLPSTGSVGTGVTTQVSSVVTLVPGFTPPELSLTLVRGGVISGHLRDPNGRLVPNLTISAYQVTYRDGRGVLTAVKTTQTDDRGEYRLFYMAPGSYLVGVTPRRPGATPTLQDAYARTFYPGLTDPRLVPPVVVTDGADIPSIDILIRTDATAKISGRLVGANGQSALLANPQLYLVPRDANALADSSVPAVQNVAANRTNGQFEIRNVLPGSYDLLTSGPDSTGRVSWGRARVEVGGIDIEDVVVELRSGFEIKTRLTIDGEPAPSNPGPAPRGAEGAPAGASAPVRPGMQVRLQSKEPYNVLDNAANANMTFDPSGVYVFPNVPEGRYRIQVTPLPANAYVEDIREGSVSILDEGLNVTGTPAGDIAIRVSTKGTTVSGIVSDSEQAPFKGALVALVPAINRRSNFLLYKTVRSADDGDFVFNGVAPGEYRLFAWESVPANAWLNSDFMSLEESRGKSITVSTGGSSNIDLKVIPRGAGSR